MPVKAQPVAVPSRLLSDEKPGAVFPVPEHLRRVGGASCSGHERFLGLDEIFSGSGIADVFDASRNFRRAIRVATREDLFVPNERWSDAANTAMKGLGSTLVMDWRIAARGCPALDKVFADHGVRLKGADFLLGLGALCGGGPHVSGSLTDIVANGRDAVAHSWHADSGLPSGTVMVGFPESDSYEGAGVFSHVRLSHPLSDQRTPGSVIEWERFDPSPGPIPEENIVRPGYKKGKEVMVYQDSDNLHSAPDAILRDAVWRFM